MDSLSFDRMAELYEETRVFDESCFSAALTYLTDRFPPSSYRNMFYPGIGTGRIALPLARKGYSISGIDISKDMLALLKDKLSREGGYLLVDFQTGDVTDLPFSDNYFDIAIAVHLFYFIRDWKTAVDEILRVVKSDGAFVLMHTGMGTEVPLVNEKYEALCAEYGCDIPVLGASSTREIADYCENLGYNIEWIRDRWQWLFSIQLGKALDYMRLRAYSSTVFVPEEVHTRVMDDLTDEVERVFGSLSVEIHVPNQIYLAIISRTD